MQLKNEWLLNSPNIRSEFILQIFTILFFSKIKDRSNFQNYWDTIIIIYLNIINNI